MKNKQTEALENRGEEYVDAEKGSKKGSILSVVLCTVVAIIVWLVIMNFNDLSNTPMPVDGAAVSVEEVL